MPTKNKLCHTGKNITLLIPLSTAHPVVQAISTNGFDLLTPHYHQP